MAGVNGFFLGGAAEGMQNYADTQLKSRALGIQEAQVGLDANKALLDQADKAIAGTMTIIGDTVKGVAANPDLGSGIDAYASAISNVESGGDYGLKGPVTKEGDRAYGKYQVMGENIPVWTKEITGTAMTPEQFLANTKVQDQVFAAKFGQYVQQTGNADDAASMWFSGKPLKEAASLTDQLGTSGAEYVQRFNESLAGVPRQKIKAVVTPLLKDVTDIAAKVGKNPQLYTDSVNAMINAAPVGVDAALADGKNAAAKKIGETNGLIRAGISKADAELTAGIKSNPDGGLNADQIVNGESAMRNQYTALSKDFTVVRDAYTRVQSSTNTAAGDTALIFNYMKMLDPNSVVREGEFATVQNATGVPGRIQNIYNQLLTGGRLNGDQRGEILDQANKLYTAGQKQQTYTADQFRTIAKRSGLNPENVVVDLTGGMASPAGTKPPPGSAAAATEPAAGGPPSHFMIDDPQRVLIWKYMSPEDRALWN